MWNKLINWYFTKNAVPYWVVFFLDCLICYVAGLFIFWFYYSGAIALGNIIILTKTIFLYMCFNLIGFRLMRTYSGIIRYSSFIDLQRIGTGMLISLGVAEVMHYVIYFTDWHFIRLQGRQIAAMYVVATLGMWGYRIVVKTIYDVLFSSRDGNRAIIYGTLGSGIALAKQIRNEKPARFQLKGFYSDSDNVSGRILMGVKVCHDLDKLAAVLDEQNIQSFLVSPMKTRLFQENQALQDILMEKGVKIFVAPQAKEWIPGEKGQRTELHEISIEDLLPRDEIKVDMDAVGKMLAGRRVLITGSAGSIGSEMVRQIARYKPANMVLIDQAETPQHDIRLMMRQDYPDIEAETIVATIENKERMEHIFSTYRPDYVFHAAAYKHVPMMEDNPSESIQNNVMGTKNIADLSVKYGVRKFVMISTDKAVNPTNVMGCSKRLCEIYVQAFNKYLDQMGQGAHTQFVTTRFGNVLGSNGSVIPLFKKQILAGGPVTVTHPNIFRYFMLIPEACQLVLEAGTHGKGGEIFVFDMGKPVKIADLAKRMIQLSGAKGVEIRYTGLRAGEKLFEEVLSNSENTLPSFHEKIRIAKVREYDFGEVSRQIEELVALSRTYDDMAIVAKMKEIVPEYISNNSVYSCLDTYRKEEK